MVHTLPLVICQASDDIGSTVSPRCVRRQCSQNRRQHSLFSQASMLLARTLTCWQKWQYLRGKDPVSISDVQRLEQLCPALAVASHERDSVHNLDSNRGTAGRELLVVVGVRRSRRSLLFNDFLGIRIEASADRFAARRARRRCPGLDVTHRGPGLRRCAHARRGYRLFHFLLCELRVEVLERCWLYSALTIHQRHVASVDHFTQGFLYTAWLSRRFEESVNQHKTTPTRECTHGNGNSVLFNRAVLRRAERDRWPASVAPALRSP